MMSVEIAGRRLECVRGNTVREHVDAIVNAANPALLGGGGVDGAIHDAAGPELLLECETLGGCARGDAKITGAYRLAARYVIHAVGPVYAGGTENEAEILTRTYCRSLDLAVQHGVRSIAFPAICTGVYAFPRREVAQIAFSTILVHLQGETTLELVRYVLFNDADLEVHQEVLGEVADGLAFRAS